MELIERLEQATKGSRELDKAIWLLADPRNTRKQWTYIHTATSKVCEVDETRDAAGRLIVVPDYTTSIDAARTLVPEGVLSWRLDESPGGATAWIYDGEFEFDAIGIAPAPTFAAAALKAREAK